MQRSYRMQIIIVVMTLVLILVCLVYIVLLMRRSSTESVNILPNPSIPPVSGTPSPLVSVVPGNGSTYDADFFDAQTKYEQTERPDIIVSNNSPFSNKYFDAYTESVTEGDSGYLMLVIYSKKDHPQQTVEKEVRKWLLSLDIPELSLTKLVIEYRTPSIPMEQE